MGDLDVLTPLINSQDPLCNQDQLPENPNAWGRLYPENESLKIEGFNVIFIYAIFNLLSV